MAERTPVPGGSNALFWPLCALCARGAQITCSRTPTCLNFKSNHKRTFVGEIACGCGLSLEDEVGGILEPGV